MLLHSLALHAASRHPTRHRPLVEAKRRDDGLGRTAVGEQRHHEGDGLGRGAQAVQRGAFRSAERLVARGTQEPLVLARVDADVALAGLASGRACQPGAECCGGVHAGPPCLTLTYAKRSMAGSLFLSQPIRTTVKCGATASSSGPINCSSTRRQARPERAPLEPNSEALWIDCPLVNPSFTCSGVTPQPSCSVKKS